MTYTVRQQLLLVLGHSEKPMTAVQLVSELDKSFPTRHSAATLSSALKKMYDDNLVCRIAGVGLRGGYGYKLTFVGVGFYLGVMEKAFANFSEAVRGIVER